MIPLATYPVDTALLHPSSVSCTAILPASGEVGRWPARYRMRILHDSGQPIESEFPHFLAVEFCRKIPCTQIYNGGCLALRRRATTPGKDTIGQSHFWISRGSQWHSNNVISCDSTITPYLAMSRRKVYRRKRSFPDRGGGTGKCVWSVHG